MIELKRCTACGITKPIDDFYRSLRQVHSYCKTCHNQRCKDHVRKSASRKASHALAKRRWTVANPISKRAHEGRSIFLHRSEIAPILKELEWLKIKLSLPLREPFAAL